MLFDTVGEFDTNLEVILMKGRRIGYLRCAALVAAVAMLALVAACGQTAAPEQAGGTDAAAAPTPTVDVMAAADDPTPTARLDATPTAVPVPTVMAVDERPAWWVEGEGKLYRGDFPLVAQYNPGFWDVHYGGSMNTVLIPSGPRFNQLLEYNPVNPSEIIGDLALDWESYQDGDEFGYIFHLNPTAEFTDGHPVTAEDVVYSLNRITVGQVEDGVLRARTGMMNNFLVYNTFEALDDYTVKVPLRYAAASFLPNLASDYMKVYPKHVAEHLTQEQANKGIPQAEAIAAIEAGQPTGLIGSGPWMLREWEKDTGYTFDRNPNYFKTGRPFFDGLRVYLIVDVARNLSALQTGQVYGTYQSVTTHTPENAARLEQDTDGRVRALILVGSAVQAYFLNITKPPFDDPRVRRAVYLALDRDLGVSQAVQGYGLPGTFFSPNIVEDLEATRANDPAFSADRTAALTEARELLAAAGYPDGFEVTLNVVNTVPSLPAAEVTAPQFRDDLNIDIVLQPTDLATMYVGMRDGVANMSSVGTGIILRDPGDIVNQFYLQDVLRNPHNWQNERVDELIDLQNEAIDPAERQRYLQEMADILHRGESHWLPYFWYSTAGAYDYRIRNFQYPPTVQLIKKWDHQWFDPDREIPDGVGYVP